MLYFLIGITAGIISGMGIGGGVILIPALTILMSVDQYSAQAVNLIYFIPTAIIALITHLKNKTLTLKPLPRIIAGGVLGALAGSFLATQLDSAILKKLFGGFILLIGINEFFNNTGGQHADN